MNYSLFIVRPTVFSYPISVDHGLFISGTIDVKSDHRSFLTKFLGFPNFDRDQHPQVKVPDGKSVCPDRPRRKVPMSRLSCVYQTFVRSCPDFRSFTRLSCVHVQTFVRSPDYSCVHDQTFVRSPDFLAFMSRLSCVHQTIHAFMSRLSCVHQTIRAFMIRLSCVHQTFVRSPDFRACMSRLSCVHQTIRAFMIRLSCVHQTFVRSCPDFCAFTRLSCVHVQIFVRSPDYSCVHDQTFVRSPDYSCIHVQTFMRFSVFPDHVILNARHPRRAFIWVCTYQLSVWDLNLGRSTHSLFISDAVDLNSIHKSTNGLFIFSTDDLKTDHSFFCAIFDAIDNGVVLAKTS